MIDRTPSARLFSATMKFRSLLAFLTISTCSFAADKAAAPATPSPWGDFVEKDFPFFSSVLDCREVGEGFPKDNLTPRGLILNLGHNLWACFDTDLLRIACIWEGEPGKPPVTPDALAPGSYHVAGQKTKDGQDYLPKPIGKVWMANGIYPGWQVGEKPSFTDPREPTPSPEEVGRGPLVGSRFKSIRLIPPSNSDKTLGRFELNYSVDGIDLIQTIQSSFMIAATGGPVLILVGVNSSIQIPPHSQKLHLQIGKLAGGKSVTCIIHDHSEKKHRQLDLESHELDGEQYITVSIPPSEKPQILDLDTNQEERSPIVWPNLKMASIWPQTLATTATLSTKPDAYVVDDIPLPLSNPWKRNVRLADIAFLNDKGDAAGVTFDGDVWLISGLKGDLEKVTWKRFASGLHEPMSIVARPREQRTLNIEQRTLNAEARTTNADNSMFNVQSSLLNVDLLVFDRSGIWELVDTNGDKECDRYEMFCNLFAQTAETREFPNSMKLGPKGELFISKGGQEGTTYGKHNGTVIKIAADGKSMEVIGYGLRQPFIGVNPKTGLVTASDQQGNYVPSTPLHIISDHHFYGHLPSIAPKEKYPETITEPLTWIPHPVNPSGVTQTWLLDAKMGPVNDELIHIGYNRPELFRVLMNTHFEKPQAAVVSFSRNFDFPTLNAVVNPADGQLYVVGFQVWGTVVKKISGLARVRYTDKPRVLLMEATPTDKGLLLRFNAKMDPKLATDPDSFNGERWNYKRTFQYGSPHLKLDGSSGQEWMTASSAYLSKDGMSVLVGFPDMKASVDQMRIGWGLKSVDGHKAESTAYFSPWELLTFDAKKLGFDENLKVDLTPRKAAAVAAVKATAVEGERLYQMYGCMACHSTDGTLVGKVGPSWKGLYGSERDIAKGQKGKFKADEAYLRESIINPSAKVVKGFEKFDTGMPIYSGILNDSQIESLILYIKSLK
jgi:cytochrome c551/c552/glucose/arabinose dehydrogenase